MKDTKEKIMIKALTYFAEADYERSSLNDIAAALDVTKGAIYHYFGSKDDLFRECILFTLNSLEKVLTDIPMEQGMSARELLQAYFSMTSNMDGIADMYGLEFLKLVMMYENFIYLMFAGIRKFDEIKPRLDEIYSRNRDLVISLLKRAEENGEIKKGMDLEALSFEINSYLEGSMLMRTFSENINYDELNIRVFENFWERIKA